MFSRRFDMGVKVGGAVIGAVAAIAFLLVFFGVRNDVADVGYRPEQPVPFSHKLHTGTLQIQCQSTVVQDECVEWRLLGVQQKNE